MFKPKQLNTIISGSRHNDKINNRYLVSTNLIDEDEFKYGILEAYILVFPIFFIKYLIF